MNHDESLPQPGARYRVLRRIGRGGMGSVYLAHDRALDREVALKIVAHGLLEHAGARARFAREARLQAQVEHPHVIQIYDSKLDGDQPYLAMELVRGQNLEERLRDQGPMSAAAVIQLLEQLGDAMDTLHAAGILHRDLKPGNVMLRDQDGSAVLMDLGLASQTEATVLTATGQLVGTPRYMPPEVGSDRGWLPASDQWQLAAVAFEALTGAHLVPGTSLQEVFGNVARGAWTPFPPESALPAGLCRAILRAAAVSPEARFPDCRSLARAAAGPAPEAAPPAPPGDLAPAQASGAFRRDLTDSALALPRPRWRRAAGITGAALVLAAGAWVLAGRAPREIRWRLAGDALVVRFQGDDGVRLEVDGETVAATCDPGGDCRAVRRQLPAGRPVRARLVWRGGGSPRTEWRAEPPAVRGRARLGEEHTVRVEVLRPCRLRLPDAGAPWIDARPGVVHLAPPPGALTSLPVEWREEELLFTRELTWEALAARAAEEIAGLPDQEAYRPWLVDWLNGRGDASVLEGPRLAWRELETWVPELLAGPGSLASRWEVFERWEAWQRAARVGQLFRHARPARPLPRSRPGSRSHLRGELPEHLGFADSVRPDRDGEHQPEKHRFMLMMRHRIRLVEEVGRHRAALRLEFPWPAGHPRDGRALELCLRVAAFEEEGQALVAARDEAHPFRVNLWHPDPRPARDEDYAGWITAVLTGAMAPPAGTPMVLTYEPFFRERSGDMWLEDLEIRWGPAPR